MSDDFELIKRWDDNHVSPHVEPYINYISSFLNNYCKDNKIYYIDIGANTGKVFDILIRNNLIKIEHAYLFEPNTKLYKYLIHKYENNNIVSIYDFIISNENGSVNFDEEPVDVQIYENTSYINFGLSCINKLKINNMKETHKISEFIVDKKLYNEKIFIKIDTENNDIFILQDILSIMDMFVYKPMIIFEVNFKNNEKVFADSIFNAYQASFDYDIMISDADGMLLPRGYYED